MKLSDAVILFILFVLLFVSMYFLWLNLPIGLEKFESYAAEIPMNLPNKTVQFYSNMRYADKKISYLLSGSCSKKRATDFENALALLEERTILSFFPSNTGEITVSCSNIAPMATEENHFIAGEGGPSIVINVSSFSVILSGRIALYRPETCPEPKIATHELLHALGFDHNNNQQSIMYPITSCDQEIDSSIIEEINRLYSIPPRADLVIEQASANKSGRFLNFEATIANYGFKDVTDFSLNVKADGSIAKTFTIEGIKIGAKRRLTVTNLRIARNAKEIILEAITTEQELSKDNNVATLSVVES